MVGMNDLGNLPNTNAVVSHLQSNLASRMSPKNVGVGTPRWGGPRFGHLLPGFSGVTTPGSGSNIVVPPGLRNRPARNANGKNRDLSGKGEGKGIYF